MFIARACASDKPSSCNDICTMNTYECESVKGLECPNKGRKEYIYINNIYLFKAVQI